MLFKRQVERAFTLLRERRQARQAGDEDMPLEKGDVTAMIIAALITLVPVALIVLVLMVLLPMLFTLLR
ncbi:MAG: hypothetical protein GX653_04385 [Clostridiales bacterium]|nr:hypothetical protein [Clostridiales bacterium]